MFIYDPNVFKAIVDANIIDIKNIAYDYNIFDEEYTWNPEELAYFNRNRKML